jgi:succinyl-CoA synthetase beta subunit
VDLLEYQARDLFAAYDVPVPPARLATTCSQAFSAAEALGGRVVVKAQVRTGGRGKAGGVRPAATPEEAAEHAAGILGTDISGHRVRAVLVAEQVDVVEEYYLGVLLDRVSRTYLAILSRTGGVEVERLAVEHPEALVRVPVDPLDGIDAAGAAALAAAAGLPAGAAAAVAGVIVSVWSLFTAQDALLVEINPLALTRGGGVVALDGKVTLDDNAAFRHEDHALYADGGATDPLEARAAAKGLTYVKLDGSVGIIGNGAGLVMSTLDAVADAGGTAGGARPANFLDIGGGASASVMADSLGIVLDDPQVTSVLVNVFGGITACDAVADGIVAAHATLAERGREVRCPLVVRLDGNNADLGRAILAGARLPHLEQADTMDGAARRVAELAAGRA